MEQFPLFHCIPYYSRDFNRHKSTLEAMQLKLKEKKKKKPDNWTRVNPAISTLSWRSGSDPCTLSQKAEFQGLGEMSAGPWTFSGYDILRDDSGLKVTEVGILCKKKKKRVNQAFFPLL